MNKLKELKIPSPCDECFFYMRCADEKLACEPFYSFVEGERTRERKIPRKYFYNWIFPNDKG